MKSPEAVLRSALLASTAVTTVVGSKVYPLVAPAKTPAGAAVTLPYITYRRAGIQRQQTMAGPMGVPTVSVDFDVFATSYEGARDLADRCRVVLDGYRGTVDNTTVSRASLENEQDDFIQLDGADLPRAYAVKMTFQVMWQES